MVPTSLAFHDIELGCHACGSTLVLPVDLAPEIGWWQAHSDPTIVSVVGTQDGKPLRWSVRT